MTCAVLSTRKLHTPAGQEPRLEPRHDPPDPPYGDRESETFESKKTKKLLDRPPRSRENACRDG